MQAARHRDPDKDERDVILARAALYSHQESFEYSCSIAKIGDPAGRKLPTTEDAAVVPR